MNRQPQTLLIVDDEPPARQRLERLVGELPGWTCVGSCADGEAAIAEAGRLRPAVVLLDIRMPGMNGIEAARHLSRLEHPPAVIFCTAYDQYAVEAFDSRAVGYLLKPVRRERLESTLAHAARLSDALLTEVGRDTRSARRHIAVRERGTLRLVPVAEVRYFRAEQKYVSLHHAGGEALIEESLKQLEDEFGDSFVRIHRSLLVAVDAIDSVDRVADGTWQVRLRGMDGTLPVSRRQLMDLKSRLRSGR